MTVTEITEAAGEAARSVRDITTGAILETAETVSHPAARVRREASRTAAAAQGLFPERIAVRGLGLVKARARRVDLVGEMAYRYLDLVHGALQGMIGTLNRLERASAPPARPSRPLGRAAATSAGQVRTAAGRTARRSATAGRRSVRIASPASPTRARRTASTRRRAAARRSA